ncbi:hypothetical protein AB0D12_34805 [Streptomyces sp. NPDC048479]
MPDVLVSGSARSRDLLEHNWRLLRRDEGLAYLSAADSLNKTDDSFVL